MANIASVETRISGISPFNIVLIRCIGKTCVFESSTSSTSFPLLRWSFFFFLVFSLSLFESLFFLVLLAVVEDSPFLNFLFSELELLEEAIDIAGERGTGIVYFTYPFFSTYCPERVRRRNVRLLDLNSYNSIWATKVVFISGPMARCYQTSIIGGSSLNPISSYTPSFFFLFQNARLLGTSCTGMGFGILV